MADAEPKLAVEPRFGVDWIIRDHHTLTFGAGLYSQMQPRVIYFVLSPMPDGTYNRPTGTWT